MGNREDTIETIQGWAGLVATRGPLRAFADGDTSEATIDAALDQAIDAMGVAKDLARRARTKNARAVLRVTESLVGALGILVVRQAFERVERSCSCPRCAKRRAVAN